jgi:hypothetical protein
MEIDLEINNKFLGIDRPYKSGFRVRSRRESNKEEG